MESKIFRSRIASGRHGFSLIETMIALGVISVLALGGAHIIAQQQKATTQLASRQGSLGLSDDLRAVLLRQDSCRAQLQGQKVLAATGGPLEIRLQNGEVAKAGATLSIYNVKISGLTVAPIQTLAAPGPGLNLIQANVILQTESQSADSVHHKPRPVGVVYFVTDSADNVVDCYGEVTPREVCETMGGTYNAATTPSCRLPPRCDQGRIDFETFPNGPSCLTLDQAMARLCPANTIPRVNPSTNGVQCVTAQQLVGSSCSAGTMPVSTGSGVNCFSPHQLVGSVCPAGQFALSNGSGVNCVSTQQLVGSACPNGTYALSTGSGVNCVSAQQMLGSACPNGTYPVSTGGGISCQSPPGPPAAPPAPNCRLTQWESGSTSSNPQTCPAGYTFVAFIDGGQGGGENAHQHYRTICLKIDCN